MNGVTAFGLSSINKVRPAENNEVAPCGLQISYWREAAQELNRSLSTVGKERTLSGDGG